ncbi:LysM domain [Dillenia turbinata]|uniref:LysM domain n=1 Tax=Dillenia turbinata TaxID=194707 RepID=A0AAN8YY68_9MAGN
MAMAANKTTIFLNLILVLSLLLLISVAESRGIGSLGKKGEPECNAVVGVKSGDTCDGIAKEFNLTTEFFNAINPNVNCDALFVAQWICVDGTVN